MIVNWRVVYLNFCLILIIDITVQEEKEKAKKSFHDQHTESLRIAKVAFLVFSNGLGFLDHGFIVQSWQFFNSKCQTRKEAIRCIVGHVYS